MEFDENTYDKIDRFLNNEMTGEELAQFENEKNTNETLANEIALQSQMKELLADTPENKLRENLKSLSNNFEYKEEKTPININRENPFKLFLQIAAAILIAGMLWWMYNLSASDSTNQEPQIVDTPQDITPPNSQNDSDETPLEDTNDIQIADEENLKENEIQTKKPKNIPQKMNPSKEGNYKYIAADFKANSSLDFLIDNNLRSNDISFSVENKIRDVFLNSLTDVIIFPLSGKVISNGDLSNQKFQVHLFSNKKSDYEDFSPISSINIDLRKLEENYGFELKKNFNLKPGLYYFMVEDEKEKIYYVNKFEVNLSK